MDRIQLIQQEIGRTLSAQGLDLVELLPQGSMGSDRVESFVLKVKTPQPATPVSNPEVENALAEVYDSKGTINIPFLKQNAILLLESGDYSLARNIYQTLVSAGADLGDTYYGLGLTFEGEKNWTKAAKCFEESIAYQPQILVYEHYVRTLMELQQWESAVEAIERALHMKGVSVDSQTWFHRRAVDACLKKNLFQKAENHLLQALEIQPRSDEFHSLLGSVYLQQGRLDESERAFSDAISINPKNHKAYLGMGCAYLVTGDKRVAYDYFVRALEVEIRNPAAIYYLVRCAFELKTYGKAEELLERYVEVGPNNPNLLYTLAGVQYHLSHFDRARRTLQKVLEMKSDHKSAKDLLNLLGPPLTT